MDAAAASIIVAIITAIIGPIVTYTIKDRQLQTQKKNNQVLQLQQLKRKPEDKSSSNDIKIISHRDNDKVPTWFTVSGTYGIKPSNSRIQLFTTTPNGSGYWPQESAIFDEGRNAWHARVHVGGITSSPAIVLAALVGPEGQALCNYYDKVGRQTQNWPSIEVLTSDISEVDRITVVRE